MMRNSLERFINDKSFPCIMAKAVMKTGHINIHSGPVLDPESFLEEMYPFIERSKKVPQKLHSFILVLEDKSISFEGFEKMFWNFLREINLLDKLKYPHDKRVSKNPQDENFSFSLMEEAFFILMLHPQSPRFARRFTYPAIVFNPHVQFEKLRMKGIFKKVRDIIRSRDVILQGSVNPMLSDFGEKSEIFQYTGKTYQSFLELPAIN